MGKGSQVEEEVSGCLKIAEGGTEKFLYQISFHEGVPARIGQPLYPPGRCLGRGRCTGTRFQPFGDLGIDRMGDTDVVHGDSLGKHQFDGDVHGVDQGTNVLAGGSEEEPDCRLCFCHIEPPFH